MIDSCKIKVFKFALWVAKYQKRDSFKFVSGREFRARGPQTEKSDQ